MENRIKNTISLLMLILIALCFAGCDEQHMVTKLLFSEEKPWITYPAMIIIFILSGIFGFLKPKGEFGLIPLFFYSAIIIIEVILLPRSHTLLPFVLMGSLFLGTINWLAFYAGKEIKKHITKKQKNKLTTTDLRP